MEILFWVAVLTWMVKRSAEDVAYAVKGKPNPRYELKKAKALAAGRPAQQQPRYGGREWFADLFSDALAANTAKRRKKAAVKAQPIDELVEVTREPKPTARAQARRGLCPVCLITELPADGGPCPTCEFWRQNNEATERKLAEYDRRHETREPPAPPQPEPDDRPDARIIQFPNVKTVEKEISMSNEVTGLTTAMAFAEAAAKAHQSFATSGAEGYVGALERGGNGAEAVGSAKEAMEASSIAADKWAAHREVLAQQQTVKEAYQGQPDAANKEFLLAE